MYGGGEEYFLEPPEFDLDTLVSFAKFCERLRRLEKPGKKAIQEAAVLARDIGDTEAAYDLVVGALFRHIKCWTGTKQLACWYVLDKLCKEDRDKYGFIAEKYILEIGRDYIPFEDEDLGAKYESLVEHWESVFSRHVVDALWLSKKERLWAVDHPDEVLLRQKEEEQEWEAEEKAMEDIDGLDNFGQPCMDYLQGRCGWGDECRLYHPPGEEGSLPKECRMGDWKCKFCGAINRHFRRRCSNCVQEKPQYKRERVLSKEDALLSSPDPQALAALRHQFGYDPCVTEDAVEHWKLRLQGTTTAEYLAERRAAYRVRILRKQPTSALETRCQTQQHYPETKVPPSPDLSEDDDDNAAGSKKRLRVENALPSGTAAAAAAAIFAQTIIERGVRDPSSADLFRDLGTQLQRIGNADNKEMTLNEAQAEAVLSACKLGFTAWNANRSVVPFVSTFFKSLYPIVNKLRLSDEHSAQLEELARDF